MTNKVPVFRFFFAFMLLAYFSAIAAQEVAQTRITTYAVNTTIVSRFARTHISIDIVNDRNCSTVKRFTMQLPLNARVTSLSMSLSNGCNMSSEVKSEAEASADFEESVQEGKPAAFLQAYNSTNYAVQVSIPPGGETRVKIITEELLQRIRGKIAFQIPVFPGLSVENLLMDMSIMEPSTSLTAFDFIPDQKELSGIITVDMTANNTQGLARLKLSGITADGQVDGVTLPRLLKGYYDSNVLPAEGLLLPDTSGMCFVHLFNPTDAILAETTSMPRNIVFVIDVSGSMGGQKLDDAKQAFAAIIENLSDSDYFAVQTFSTDGIQGLFGPTQADTGAKEEGKSWVEELSAGGGTNLEGAYVDGINRIKDMQFQQGTNSSYVPIVMILTDGQATQGVTDAVTISQNVKKANDGVQAKVYGLAFGQDADFTLLSGISIQNEGTAVRIYEGYGDSTTQMENFYVGELGSILLSDVSVSFDGNVPVDTQTMTRFPVFAGGSEIAVRARIAATNRSGQGSILRATTSGTSLQGNTSWSTQADMSDPNTTYTGSFENECMQSFAHAKIAELMLFRDAAARFGTVMNDYSYLYSMNNGVSLKSGDDLGSSGSKSATSRNGSERALYHHRDLASEDVGLANAIESQAMELALDAGVVWPGLTAMVTVEDGGCASFNTSEVCYDGERSSAATIEMGPATIGAATIATGSIGSAARGSAGTFTFVSLLPLLIGTNILFHLV